MIIRALWRNLFACFPQILIFSYFSLVTLSIVYAPNIYANPEGGVVAAGQAVISAPAPNTVQINQSSQNAVVNWQSYNVGHHEQVNYQQPNAQAITLNRINPANGVSQIFGAINANGRVWLINPAGIWFGPTSQVNVAGLLATTAGISNEDFMSGNYHFTQAEGWNGSVINEGYIMVTNAGLVALVGPGAVNRGEIIATFGTVVLGSGKSFTVDFAGDSLLQFDVGSEVNRTANDQYGNPLAGAIENSGTIIANGGKIQMTAKTAATVLDNAINMSGVAIANSVGIKNGEIILSAGNGRATVTGTVRAAGVNTGEKGGVIKILGNEVVLAGHSVVDASGDSGGGTILVGGNARGAGSEQRASYAFMGSNASMLADAIRIGDGGKIVLWSDLGTQFYGNISARGGAEGGNGGWVETSGKEYLAAFGSVVASAAHGSFGFWLLDPRNVTITNSTTNGAFDGGSPNIYTPVGDSATVNAATINASLNAGTNVEVNTGATGAQAGNITVSSAISKSVGASTPTLTLSAAGSIAINAAIGFTSGGLGLILSSGGPITQTAALTLTTLSANAGANAITLTNAGNNFTGAVSLTTTGANTASIRDANAIILGASSVGGGLNVTTAGTITQSGSLSVAGTTTLAAGAGNSITLNDVANDFNTVGITTGLNVSLVDANALVLGAATVSGTLGVTAAGAITQSGALTVTGVATLAAGAANDIMLNSANNFSTIAFTNGNNVAFTDSSGVILGASTISGTFGVTAAGAITQSGALSVAGIATLAAGAANSITLNNVANDFNTVGITSGLNVSLVDANALVLGASTVSGTLGVTTSGAITQSGALTVTGVTTLAAGAANDITLNAANNFSTVGVTNANNVSLNDTNALILGSSTVSGTMGVTTAGAITQSGVLSITGATTLASGAANSITLSNAGNNFSSVGITNALNVALTDANALVLAASTISGTLGVTTSGALTQLGALVVTGVTTLAAGAANSITLNDAGNNFSTVGVTTALNVDLTDLNALIFGASTISGTLNANTTGAITQSGALAVTGVTTLSAGAANNITLNSANNFSTLIIGSGNNVGVTDANALILGASTISGTLGVTTAGLLSQSGALSVAGITTLAAGTSNSITLNDVGNDFNTVGITSGLNVSLVDANALVLGASTVSGTYGLTTSGAITQSGALTVTGVATLAAGAANDITLNSANNFSTIGFTNGNNVAFTDSNAVILGASTINGNLGVTAVGAVTQSGALAVTGATTIAAGAANSITLNNVGNDFNSVGITSALNVALTDSNALNLAASTISGTLGVITSGAITQTGALAVTGLTTLAAGAANSITLNDSANNFSTVAITNGLNVGLSDVNALILAASTVSGTLDVNTSGAITQSGALAVTGAATLGAGAANNITLNAANNFSTIGITSGNNVSIVDSNALNFAASTVSGTLGVSASGAVTQSGALSVAGLTTLSVGVGNNITLNDASNDFSTVSITTGLNVGLTDANSLILGTTNVSGTYGVMTSGAITQSGALTVVGVTTLAAGAANDITLTTATNNFSTVSTTSGNNVSLRDSGGLTIGATTIANSLTVTAASTITQSGVIEVPNLTVKTMLNFGAGIILNTSLNKVDNIDLRARNTADTANAAGAISYQDEDGFNIANSLATISTISLIAGGDVTQNTGAGSGIFGTTLTVLTKNNSGAAVTLTNSLNNVTTIDLRSRNAADSANAAGALAYTDLNAVGIAAANTTSTVDLIAGNAITQSGTMTGSTLTAKTLLDAGAAITLNIAAGNEFNTINLLARNTADTANAAGAISYRDATGFDVAGIATTSTLSLQNNNTPTNSPITQSGAIVAGVTTLIGGATNNITLNNAGNDFGTVATTSGLNVALTDTNALILGASTVSGTLDVNTTGAITQSGVLTVTGMTTLAAGAANNITLNSANNFSTIGITSGNNVGITDANALILAASTVSGTLGVTTNGAITQTGALSVVGGTTLAAGAANSITLNNASNDFNSVAISSALNVALTDVNTIALGTSTISGTLGVNVNGAITQIGALTVTGVTTLTGGAANNITLNLANNFSTLVMTNANNVSINDTNGLILGASIIGGTMGVTTAGAISQSGALAVTGAATFASGATNSITLNNAANNFSSIGFTNALNVVLTDSSAIALAASTISGTLGVTASGAITQLGALVVTGATTLAAGAANSIALTNVANNFSTVGVTNALNVALTDLNALIFAASTISGTLNAITSGAITQSGSLVVAGITTLNAGSANNITLNSANNFSTVVIGSGNNVALTDSNALILGASTISGNLGVTTNGSLTQSGALSVAGIATLAAGAANSITLTNAGNNFNTLGVTTGLNVSLVDSNALVLGTSTISGTLGVTTNGALTQSGALTITGLTTLTAGAGNNITLVNAANNFSTVAAVSGNDISLRDAGAIILAAINASTSLSVTGGGAITQTAVITAPTLNAKTLLNAGAGISLNIAAGNNANVVNLQARNLADTANAAGAIAYRGSAGFDLSGVATTSTLSLQNNNTITNSPITQSGAIVAGATTLIGGATNNLILNNPANNFSSVTITNGLNVVLADTNALSLGASTVSGTLDVATNGAITQSGALTVTNAATFGAGAANNITLNSANNFSSIGFNSGNNVAFTDINTVVLGASTITGTLGVNTTGAITQNGALAVAGVTTLAPGAGNNITLTNSGNLLSTVGVTSASNVSLVNAAALNFAASTINGTLNVVTNGDITQTGALGVTGLTTLTAGFTNNITLTNSANNFSGVNVVSANNISLRDTNAIVIGTMNAASSLNLISGGTITQSGVITVPSLIAKTLGTGLAITLNTFANEVDNLDLRSRNAGDTANSSGAIAYRDATGFNVANSIATTSTVNLTAGGSMTQNSGAGTGIFASTLTAKTLDNTGAAILFNNPLNNVATIDLRARNLTDTNNAAGALSYADTNAVVIAAANTLSTVDLSAGGALTQTGSMTGTTLTAKTLANAGAAITFNLPAGNEFTAINLQSRDLTDTANAAGPIAYRDATGFDIVGIQTTSSVSLQNNNTPTNSPITQSGSIIADAVTIIGGAFNDVVLNDVNNLINSIAVTSGLDVTVANNNALVLAASTISGAFNVMTGGAITQTGALAVTGLTTLASGATNHITLNNLANNFSAVAVTNALNVSLVDANALVLAASTVAGSLNVSVSGAISQSGVLAVAGATTLAAGAANNIILNAANSFNSIGITTGNNVSVSNASALVLNQSQISGTLGVFSGGAVTQSGDLTVAGAGGLTVSSVGGTLLTNAGNQIANLNAANTGSGDIQVTSAGPLTIDGLSQAGGGSVTLTTMGTLSVANGVNANSGNGVLTILANDFNLNASGSLNSGSADTIIHANSGTLGIGLAAGTMSISKSELQRITANNLSLQGASNVNLLVDGVAVTDVNNISGKVVLGNAAANSTVTFANNASSFKAVDVLADLAVVVNVPLSTTTGDLSLSANSLALNGGSVTSAGSQAYNGALTLGADTTMVAGGNINFNNTVNSSGVARNLTLNSGAANDINFNANVGDAFRLGTITINNANNVTNNAVIKSNEWTQLAGNVTSFGAGGLDTLGAVYLIAGSVTGNVIVNALSLGTATANLIGSVNGSVGQAAIDKIVLLNTITAGTHYFDGIDMYPAPIPPVPPSPPVPNGLVVSPQEIFASYLSLNSTLTPELKYGVQYDESYNISDPGARCVKLRPYLDMCNLF